MAINRFSRGPIAADVQSEFIPLPLDIISRQIDRRQTQYDKAKAAIGASREALYGVQGMSPDTETLSNIVGEYDKFIEDEVSKAGGDYSRLTGISDVLANKVSRDLKSGHLGAIHNNFIKAQNHLKELGDLRKDGKISEAGYNKALSSISSFGGTVEDGKGGYTRAAFYQPTKYAELGELGDTYGKTIHEQYLATGEKYLNASNASNFIFKNLYNNPQARDNAKEQVWAQYGDLDPEQEDIAVRAYLKSIASASGNKLAFRQRFKPDGTDKLTGGMVISVDSTTQKPITSRVKVGGQTLEDRLSQMNKIKTSKGISRAIDYVMSGKGFTTMSPRGGINQPESVEPIVSDLNTYVENTYDELMKDDFLVNVAKYRGIDISNPENRTEENLLKLADILDKSDKASANTQYSLTLDEDTEKLFDRTLNPVTWREYNVINFDTGEPVEGKEKTALLDAHLLRESKEGPGKIVLGGEVLKEDQPLPPGTKMFGILGSEDRYAIIPNNVNSDRFRYNKYMQAAKNGYSEYKEGGQTVQLIPTRDGKLREYRNGKFTTNINLK